MLIRYRANSILRLPELWAGPKSQQFGKELVKRSADGGECRGKCESEYINPPTYRRK
jgi:hypothetical protein